MTTDEGVTIFVNPVQVAYVADEAEMPRGWAFQSRFCPFCVPFAVFQTILIQTA